MSTGLKGVLPVLNPPYNGKLTRLIRFFVEFTIAEVPQDLSKMLEWIECRKQMNKPLHIGLRHVNSMGAKMVEIKLHDEHSPLWICPITFEVYIDADKHHRCAKHDSVAWRYILYYCGYKLKKRKIKGTWFGDRKKYKQMQLQLE